MIGIAVGVMLNRGLALLAKAEQRAAVGIEHESADLLNVGGCVVEDVYRQCYDLVACHAVSVQVALGRQVISGGAPGQLAKGDDPDLGEEFQGPVHRGAVHPVFTKGIVDVIGGQMVMVGGQDA